MKFLQSFTKDHLNLLYLLTHPFIHFFIHSLMGLLTEAALHF